MPIEERYRNFGFAILEAIKERSEEFEYDPEEYEGWYRGVSLLPSDFSVWFGKWFSNNGNRERKPFYVMLFRGENDYLIELDLTRIVQNADRFTWFLAEPTNQTNKDVLDNLLKYDTLPDEYRKNIIKNKKLINAGVNPKKQGYLLCENASWDELVTKFVEVIMAVAAAHGCDVGKIRDVEAAVARSLRDLQFNRLQRIAVANKIPVSRLVQTTVFDRNQDIIDETLFRANGICERCNCKAPFCRASDNTPYLEVHHKKQLSHGGEDSLENAIALCPNCHREVHYGVSSV